jgi:ubiquinone/menaquinone biosynthesis C-methylase UbiE
MEKYNKEWYEASCGRLFIDKTADWLYYRRTAEFACKNLDKKSLILEIGCGLGTLSYRLAQYCDRIIGIDISEYACIKAKSMYPSQQISFVVANAEQLPFKSKLFAGIVVSHLFEHLDDQETKKVQQEIYRVLKLGGTLTIEQPTYGKESIIDIILLYLFSSRKNKELYYYTKKAIREAKKKYPGVDFHHLPAIGNPTHKRIYDIKLLVAELKSAGFTKFCFYRRRLFYILFFGSYNLFEFYVWLYLKAPEIIRKVLLISPSVPIKVIKL